MLEEGELFPTRDLRQQVAENVIHATPVFKHADTLNVLLQSQHKESLPQEEENIHKSIIIGEVFVIRHFQGWKPISPLSYLRQGAKMVAFCR